MNPPQITSNSQLKEGNYYLIQGLITYFVMCCYQGKLKNTSGDSYNVEQFFRVYELPPL